MAISVASAHGGRVLGLHLINHANFTRLRVGIFVYAQVFLRQFVNVIVGALLGNLGHAATNLEIAIWIFGIGDGHGDSRITAHVAILLPALGRIKDDMLAVVVNPNGRHLGASVWHQSSQTGERAFLKQVGVLFGDGTGHASLLEV